ncbi:MAG: hypothetical protein K5857_08255 [Lachnospiraceae bacterium]|nr:hypothetical protein [Lachnospiraceae bacterium]
MSCYENVHTREELLEQEKLWSSVGLGGIGIAFNSVLIIAGILLIVIKPKVKE